MNEFRHVVGELLVVNALVPHSSIRWEAYLLARLESLFQFIFSYND